MTMAQTEVPAKQGSDLPQLNTATYESQLAWLAIVFALLYFIVSRVVLPKVDHVLEDREENIAGNLDTADRLQSEAEEIKAEYEAAVAEARMKAQKAAISAKEVAKAKFDMAQAELDKKLSADSDEATARIAKATDAALDTIGDVAKEVSQDLIAKLSGSDADEKTVSKAVEAALDNTKGA